MEGREDIVRKRASFNGATAFRRWKQHHGRSLRDVPKLQWGHRLSAMETNRPTILEEAQLAEASMGPPPFGDGNAALASRTCCRDSCFNGATAFRRWKRPERRFKHMGGYVLQWGHRLSAMETRSPRSGPHGDTGSFNGATAFRRWKREGWGIRSYAIRELQWGHRLSAMETIRIGTTNITWLHGFNGATAFRRWKPQMRDGLPSPSLAGFNGATAFRRWKRW